MCEWIITLMLAAEERLTQRVRHGKPPVRGKKSFENKLETLLNPTYAVKFDLGFPEEVKKMYFITVQKLLKVSQSLL